MQKSQSAMEFIMIASFMMVVMLGFFAITSSKVIDVQEENNRKIAQDIAEFAYREIEIATSVNNGYKRLFAMPSAIEGMDYTINITDSRELIVDYMGYEYIKFLPANVTGNISKGVNIISKERGIILINASYVQLPPALISMIIMKGGGFNAIRFDNNGNVILRGTLQQNTNPTPTIADEFIFKDSIGNIAAIINLESGNMAIKGSLYELWSTLTPSGNDFIVKSSNGDVISYIDESGNFYLKGTLTQNGSP